MSDWTLQNSFWHVLSTTSQHCSTQWWELAVSCITLIIVCPDKNQSGVTYAIIYHSLLNVSPQSPCFNQITLVGSESENGLCFIQTNVKKKSIQKASACTNKAADGSLSLLFFLPCTPGKQEMLNRTLPRSLSRFMCVCLCESLIQGLRPLAHTHRYWWYTALGACQCGSPAINSPIIVSLPRGWADVRRDPTADVAPFFRTQRLWGLWWSRLHYKHIQI